MILLKRLRLSSILFSVMSSYNIWSYLVTIMMTLMVTMVMKIVDDTYGDGGDASNNKMLTRLQQPRREP